MESWRKALALMLLVTVVLLLSLPLPGVVLYKHHSYFYWGPSTPHDRLECGIGKKPFEFLDGFNYDRWNVSVSRVGDVEKLVAERSFLSHDGYGITYQRILVVKKDGHVVEIHYTETTGPSKNAYKEVCYTLKNGTRVCNKVLTVYDLDSRRVESFIIYRTLWGYLRGCRAKRT